MRTFVDFDRFYDEFGMPYVELVYDEGYRKFEVLKVNESVLKEWANSTGQLDRMNQSISSGEYKQDDYTIDFYDFMQDEFTHPEAIMLFNYLDQFHPEIFEQ